ncbi:ferritin-like domain-containing protein [Moorella sulfitireducens (nom. illeg.)]|uniref:ferritin-like domain-containing protein n=1 Tax=Neomoorella sulfitireducens TaxID=2972948 RepID=UPI0021ABA4DB|nr:ferritin-like domain-containing protein [Moorella sulfitireducens]
MHKKDLIRSLNWFYTLEIEQVDLYQTQARAATDIYLRQALTRIAAIEQEHVINLEAEIRRRGATPTRTGAVIAPLLGVAAATVLNWTNTRTVLWANITLEEKAIADYKGLILKVADKPLFDLLWRHLIDEDLHAAWYSNKLKELDRLALHKEGFTTPSGWQ